MTTQGFKGTAGPWQALSDWGRIPGHRQPSSICHCGDWTVATTNPSYEFHGTDEADARLIAAAPDLIEPWLAADDKDWDHLFAMIPDSGHGQFWKRILHGHRAAISKALGGDAL